MNTTEPLAHSPRDGAGAQTYRVHVGNVRRRALRNAVAALRHYAGDAGARGELLKVVSAAALYHDLGKMDGENQAVLGGTSGKGLPVKHEDAGVAALLAQGRTAPAHLVYAHHAGLVETHEARKRLGDTDYLRDDRDVPGAAEQVRERSNSRLAEYLTRHETDARLPVLARDRQKLPGDGLTLRLLLSCLVDGDHGDTAAHYGREPDARAVPTRWAERRAALDVYVRKLARASARRDADKSEDERRRDALRQRVYDACRDAALDAPIRSCDAPVGSGKTTAVMAHLLRVAEERGLRHVIVVLPYTNIIRQSVEVYRKALTLPGEDPREVVAEHHHLADFGSADLRHLTTLWKAPVIVTTAVQFFETLASYHPARLRKLHELPGSALFVDEVHAAVPTALWGQIWRWFHDWTDQWGGYAVLASGSLPRFWEIGELARRIEQASDTSATRVRPYPAPDAPELLPEDLRRELARGERQRIRYVALKPVTLDELLTKVQAEPGPRLVILNTVHSAALVAREMARQGRHVLHLSTALTPADRERIVARVRALLEAKKYDDWTLVATSCVEAGMNFSFRVAFRERASASSLIQVGGRVSREAEHAGATVYDFTVADSRLTCNPALKTAQQVLDTLFSEGQVDGRSPGELALDALTREVRNANTEAALTKLLEAESLRNYRTVSCLARVIATDTRTVIIPPDLAERVRQGEKVHPRDIQRNSVQMWADKIILNKLPTVRLRGDEGAFDALYRWDGEYDPDSLGYMAGVLDRADGIALVSGGGVI
jgi:CRISPR-associated endonuclease/helicase Cas3